MTYLKNKMEKLRNQIIEDEEHIRAHKENYFHVIERQKRNMTELLRLELENTDEKF